MTKHIAMSALAAVLTGKRSIASSPVPADVVIVSGERKA
jgi:hypothetical protein